MRQAFPFLMLNLLLLSSANAVEGPIARGSRTIGGVVYFMAQTGELYEDNGDGLYTMAVAPSVSFFVSQGLSFGVDLSLLGQAQSGETILELSLGPAITYYMPLNPSTS